MSIVQPNPVLAVFITDHPVSFIVFSASIRQGYCQMDLNSERIYVKSNNADAGGHRVSQGMDTEVGFEKQRVQSTFKITGDLTGMSCKIINQSHIRKESNRFWDCRVKGLGCS